MTETLATPTFIPEMLTVEEMVALSSLETVAESFNQSFALYHAYSQVMQPVLGEALLSYDTFYNIGEILLRDFDELDSNLADVQLVFKHLKDIEEIEKSFAELDEEQKEFLQKFWTSFSVNKKSAQQEKFLQLWDNLPAIYTLFHQQLQQNGLITMGMAWRLLAEEKNSRKAFSNTWKHIAFVGFNAFNKSGEAILQNWQKQALASLWADVDAHYTNNPLHEAGHFFRRNFDKLKLKNELPYLQNLANSHLQIDVIKTNSNVAQCQTVDIWLKSLPLKNKDENTPINAAIILADEALLLPLLQAMPQGYQLNITMGYPFLQSPLFSFFQLFFEVQQDLQQHKFQSVSYKIVQTFLQHPLCNFQANTAAHLQHEIIKNNWLQVAVHHLQNHSSLGNYFFTPVQKPMQIFDRLLQILEEINNPQNPPKDPLLLGFTVQCHQAISQTMPLFLAMPLSENFSFSFIAKSLKKQWTGMTVPFEGEPVQGIQIMGLLESRGLDFDHIILLSANEGLLPRIQAPSSFLPDNIRRAYGLSVAEHQDAIFAYAFYRLLHRCKKLTLVYNAVITDQSTGEPTRFLAQLEYETNIQINRQNLLLPLIAKKTQTITIVKTQEVLRLLNSYFITINPNSFSPTQINTYLQCRLKFYFKYLAKLEEPAQVEDEVDAAIFGNVVHKLMELLYKRWMEKNGSGNIDEHAMDWMKENIETFLPEAFAEGWYGRAKTKVHFTGRLLVVAEVVKQYAEAYLANDSKALPFLVEQLESKFQAPILVEVGGKKRPVFLSGKIDRLDHVDGIYRMVDYKTGSDENEFYTAEKLLDRNEKTNNKAALQTLVYAWIFSKSFPEKNKFEPALLPMHKIQKDGEIFMHQLVAKPEKNKKIFITHNNILEYLQQLEENLRPLLEEIFNPKIAFSQTNDLDKCKYCEFAGLCERN